MSNDRLLIRLDRSPSHLRPSVASTGRGRTAGQAAPSAQPAVADPDALARLKAKEDELNSKESRLARLAMGLAEKESKIDKRLEELSGVLEGVVRSRAEMLEQNEEELITLSLKVAEKVLAQEIQNGRYKVGNIVKTALQAVRNRDPVLLRVCPGEYEAARQALEKMEPTMANKVQVVPDDSISPASCCLEGGAGKVMSDISERLKAVERNLLKKERSS